MNKNMAQQHAQKQTALPQNECHKEECIQKSGCQSGCQHDGICEKDARIADYESILKRLQADFENYMKRAEKERTELKACATAHLVTKLLTTLDDFQRALHQIKTGCTLEEFKKGIQMVYVQFQKTLAEEGLKPIDATGQFNHEKHEVLLQEETALVHEGKILEELQKGYTLNGTVLRYAKVKVARKPRTQEQTTKETTQEHEKENTKE